MDRENRNLGMDMEIESLDLKILNFDSKMRDYLDSSFANINFFRIKECK